MTWSLWGRNSVWAFFPLIAFLIQPGIAQVSRGHPLTTHFPQMVPQHVVQDSARTEKAIPSLVTEPQTKYNTWGLDILLSNDGFGLGVFYKRDFTQDLSGVATFSISESKDDRELERYDPYTGVSYVPGKLNRFLVLPLMVGAQYRLFREDIMETFRPYVNAGVGPTMVYVTPFTEIVTLPGGGIEPRQVEFFKSLGKGRPRYTAGAFVGLGANFGSEKSSIFGVNFRYYFTYLFGEAIPSLYDLSRGAVIGTKKDFGGFFITFNIGMAY